MFRTEKNFYLCLTMLLIAAVTALQSCKTTSVPVKSLTPSVESSNDDEHFSSNRIRYSDFVYSDNIRSVVLRKGKTLLTFPVIELGSADKLEFFFDDLDHDIKYYRYTFIHCSFDWQPTREQRQFYLNGFTEDMISESRYSFNTLQSYTHYRLEFPNKNISPRKSGNYVLLVWDDRYPDIPVITRRFYVTEAVLKIGAVVKNATGIDDRKYKQEIDFTVNTSLRRIDDPYRNLNIAILQNGRWDNAITNLKPRMVNGDIISYDYDDLNVFPGSNEFRRFDVRTIKHAVDNVVFIDRDSALYHIHLMADQRRPYNVYVNLEDINGKRLIATYDGNDQFTEPDYVWIYFTLKYPSPLIDGNVYVFGELSDWNFGQQNLMRYDFSEGAYKLRMLLKQGYYNYQYILLPNNSSSGDATLIEGSHADTENDYFIMVYYREPGSPYDELIGYLNINSRRR